MDKWYKKHYRRTLLDMHIEDWNEEFLSQYDPKKYFELLKKAEITAPMIYVQSHVGLCYWPTKTGIMHKAFHGKEDMVKQVFDMCREAEMPTVLYYSIIFNNREYERHPEWRMKDANGQDSRSNGGRYGLCCPNNEEYREFVKAQIREFSQYFQFEGVFFDMTFWPEVCYCKSCQKRWREKHQEPMPEIVDWNDENWLAFDQERHEWIKEFAFLCTDEVHKFSPEATVEHQYGNSIAFWRFGNNENVSMASDYIGTDLYGGIRQQSFACKAWYHLTKNRPFQYMTSRCYPTLAEHTSMKSYDQLRQCVAMTYLHHGASLLIDAIDPLGTMDERVYELIGKIYGEMKEYEPYMTEGEQSFDISLYFNLNGKYDPRQEGIHVMDHRLDRDKGSAGTMPHFDALMGASDILASHHIPYGIVNNWRHEEIQKHPVLAIMDAPGLSEEEISDVISYVRDGGNLYLSGYTDNRLLQKFFHTEMDGYTDGRMTYLAPCGESGIMEGYSTRKYPLVMFEPAVKLKPGYMGTKMATLTFPYTKPGIHWSMFPTDVHEEEYVDVNSDAYPFSTIHANPPGIETEMPGMLYTTCGKGKVIWSALPLERAERYQHGEVFINIMKMLAGGAFSIQVEASETVESIIFEDKPAKSLLVGLIETRNGYTIADTHDIDIALNTPVKPANVCMLPEKKEIAYCYEDGCLKIHLDKISVFAMLQIQW
ncbi:alpha-L-fucosidase [Robinsoniella sp. KNHs210]|uniref:alpha-L-fucosidase n=1 Tax=Robinsoniella sp. KNHs210 TaxID=1469950 RepID=UPI00048173C6|nr:alpha-L-fucosidase [Robinsoniella sp. KNHs210]